MQSSFFAVLLGFSVLIILFSVLGGIAMRNRSTRRTAARVAVPPQGAGSRSTIWSSPVWNVVGVLAGVVGAVVAVIGLFT